jgi:hypothetical protein
MLFEHHKNPEMALKDVEEVSNYVKQLILAFNV